MAVKYVTNTLAMEARVLSHSLYKYVKEAWPYVESNDFIDNWHIECICEHLEAVSLGQIPKLLINIPPGCSKPCHVDGMVLEKFKGRIRLGDVSVGDYVLTHKGRFCRVEAVHEQGELPLLEVKTRRGRVIRVEGSHPFLTARGWIQAKDLIKGDILAVIHKKQSCGTKTISNEESRALGYLIGDGCVKYGNGVFTNQDPDSIKDFIHCVRSLGFDVRVKKKYSAIETSITKDVVLVNAKEKPRCPNHKHRVCDWRLPYCHICRKRSLILAKARLHLVSETKMNRGRGGYAICSCGNTKPSRSRRCWNCIVSKWGNCDLPIIGGKGGGKTFYPSPIVVWKRKHGLEGKCSYDKRVPDAVMQGSDEIVIHFLAAYWACDGFIQSNRIGCGTVSEGLARDILHLLTRIGINCTLSKHIAKLKTRVQGDEYVSWSILSIGGEDTVAKFMQIVGNEIRHAKKRNGESSKRVGFDNVLNPDEVVSIDKSGVGECRCLTIDKDSSFAYEDVAVHNSLLCAVMWPTWEWTRDPKLKWFFASYDQELSTRDSLKCRTLIKSRWYQERWGDKFSITNDQDRKTKYDTDHGGYRLATSVGGHGTGEHPHRIVVDDPHSVKRAESEVERQAVLIWWDLTMSTRGVAIDARRVIIMQRLHKDDLSAHVLRQGGWEHINLCMRHEKARMATTCLGWNDPRKEEGELLCPDQFDEPKVSEMEKRLGAYGTAGQLQQRPVPKGGSMFKAQWFSKRIAAAPFDCRRIRFWDRASTADGGCFTAGTLLSKDMKTGAYYIEHVAKGQWEPAERNAKMRAIAMRDRAKYGPKHEPVIWVEREGGSSGRDAWLGVVRALEGFVVKEATVTGSKDVRAEPWASQLAAGNVYVVDNGESQNIGRADWDIQSYIEEHELFRPDPGKRLGSFKDQVDSSCLVKGTLIITKRGSIHIEDVTTDDEVLTRKGWKRVLWAGKTKDVSDLWHLSAQLSDGTTNWITATPDHKVWTVDKGWVPISEFRQGMDLMVASRLSSLQASYSLHNFHSMSMGVPSVPVYDINVEDEHEFFANGILVHNSGAYNLFAGQRASGGLRVYNLGQKKKGVLRIVVCTYEELPTTTIQDHRCLLIDLADPPVSEASPDNENGDDLQSDRTSLDKAQSSGSSPDVPVHALTQLIGSHKSVFADIEPKDYQGVWNDPVPPWNQTPDNLILTQDIAKRLWAFLMRRRDPSWEALVIADKDGKKSLSVAMAIADMLRLPRDVSIYIVSTPEMKCSTVNVPNLHVYEMIKATRHLVVG